MNIFKQIINAVRGVFKGSVLSEGFTSSYMDSNRKDARGLNPTARDIQLQYAFSLFLRNGFAKRLVSLPNDFIFGETLFKPRIKSEDGTTSEEAIKEAESFLATFIEENNLIEKTDKYMIDLSLNGMLVVPMLVNPINGKSQPGFLDVRMVKAVHCSPWDITDPQKVELKKEFTEEKKLLQIISSENLLSDNPGLLQGDCFYYCINNVSNQPEGVSDLLADVDLLEALYQMILNVIDGTDMQNMFVLDVEIQGATKTELEQWAKDNPIPKRPTRTIHNEKVKQEILSPNLNSVDKSTIIKTIKNFILGNWGYPPMWFADGTDANRAIAVEQGTPVFQKLYKRQTILVKLLTDLYTFALHSAIRSKEGFMLSTNDVGNFTIELKRPEIKSKMLETTTRAVKLFAEQLQIGITNGWINSETASEIYLDFLGNLGYDLNDDAAGTESGEEAKPGNNENSETKDVDFESKVA